MEVVFEIVYSEAVTGKYFQSVASWRVEILNVAGGVSDLVIENVHDTFGLGSWSLYHGLCEIDGLSCRAYPFSNGVVPRRSPYVCCGGCASSCLGMHLLQDDHHASDGFDRPPRLNVHPSFPAVCSIYD